ncbi:CACTA en-spm transposon protein [Cucumis melo var. makuwa]|nr:CACTA en-spm transposon protein [Cucumis melo var. makuwa]TYK01463.1 CACTA en-spm transposon protein [Cucumis melo var. makuwa]
MFLELDNFAGGSSSVDDNVGSSFQQPRTPTPRRRAQSRLLELERHVAVHGRIPMTIAPVDGRGWTLAENTLKVVKGNLQRFFVLDFNDQAMNRFVEHQMLTTSKKFWAYCHKHFKKYSDPEEAHANLPNILVGRYED